jgi:hypothetical protein
MVGKEKGGGGKGWECDDGSGWSVCVEWRKWVIKRRERGGREKVGLVLVVVVVGVVDVQGTEKEGVRRERERERVRSGKRRIGQHGSKHADTSTHAHTCPCW